MRGILFSISDYLNQWVFNTYNASQRQQMDSLLRLYRQHILAGQQFSDLPDDLQRASDYRQTPPKITALSFHDHFWLNKIKHERAEFRAEIALMISIICTYQRSRQHRNYFRRGSLRDPTHLLLHCMKFAFIDLATAPISISTDIECQRWCAFIDAIFAERPLFPPGVGHSHTTLHTLHCCKLVIRDQFKPKLKKKIKQVSAEQSLHYLVNNLRSSIDYTYEYFGYVIANHPESVNQPRSLAAILQNTRQHEPQADQWMRYPHIRWLAQVYLDYLPSATPSFTIKAKHTNKSNATFGIASICAKQPSLMKTYFTTRTMMMELIAFYHNFSLLQDCAKHSGNVLVFGFVQQEMLADIQQCCEFLTRLQKSLNTLQEQVKDMAQMRQSYRHIFSEHAFNKNFMVASNYYQLLLHSVSQSQQYLNQLHKLAKHQTKQHTLSQAKKAHDRYLNFRHYRQQGCGKALYTLIQQLNHHPLGETMKPLINSQTLPTPSPSAWFSDYQQHYQKRQQCYFWQRQQRQQLADRLACLLQQIEDHYGQDYQIYRYHDQLLLIPLSEKHVLPTWYDWLAKLFFPSYYHSKQEAFTSMINHQQQYQEHILYQKKAEQPHQNQPNETLTETQKKVDDMLKQGDKIFEQQCQQALKLTDQVMAAFDAKFFPYYAPTPGKC